MERQYNLGTKASIKDVRQFLLGRGYIKLDEFEDESYQHKDLGVFLDVKVPTIEDVKSYRRNFPNGLKYPMVVLTADTESTRVTRDHPDEEFDSLAAIIGQEMREIAEQLNRKRKTEIHESNYSNGERDMIFEEMKRLLSK